MTETVLTNARIVLADEIVLGSVVLRDGAIAEIGLIIGRGFEVGPVTS